MTAINEEIEKLPIKSRMSGVIDKSRCLQLELLMLLENSMPAAQLTNINDQKKKMLFVED